MFETKFNLTVDNSTIVVSLNEIKKEFVVDLTKSYEKHGYSRRKKFQTLNEALDYYFEVVKQISSIILFKEQTSDIFDKIN